MKMIGNGLRLIRVFFRLVFEMIRNYKKLNNDPDHNFLICKEICQKIVESAKIQLEIVQKEALPKLENFLLVSNHRCFFDVVFLLAAIEDTISFVAAKKPLALSNSIPLFGFDWVCGTRTGSKKNGNDKKQYCFHASGTCQGKSCLISGGRMQLL